MLLVGEGGRTGECQARTIPVSRPGDTAASGFLCEGEEKPGNDETWILEEDPEFPKWVHRVASSPGSLGLLKGPGERCRKGWCAHQAGPRESMPARVFPLGCGGSPSPPGPPPAAPHPPGRDPHCDSGAGTFGSEPLFPRGYVLTKLHSKLPCQGTAAASSP